MDEAVVGTVLPERGVTPARPPAAGGRHRQGPGGGPPASWLINDPWVIGTSTLGGATEGRRQRRKGDPMGADQSLNKLVKRGLGWSFASTGLSRLGQLISGIALARILGPNDLGVFAVATVALVLLANLNDLGIEQVLVRWPGDFAKVAPTGMTVIFGFSCALFGVFAVFAPAFAAAFRAPDATSMVRALAFGVVINGIFAVPSATLTRSFRQDRRTYADLVGFVVTTGLTLVLAVMGYGVWSLVWGRLIGNAVNSMLHMVFAPVRYRPGFDPKIARELLKGGLPLAGATLLAVAMVNVDNVIVGRMLGPTVLGLYVLAFNLSSWPVNLLSIPVARVSVPAFARLQNDPQRLRREFARSLGLLMAAAVPICVLLAVLAGPAVRVVYGEKWAGAAPALAFLAVLGLARVALQLCFDLLIAAGHSKQTMFLQGLWLVVLIPALAVGAHLGGIAGVGTAHMLVAVGVMVPAFLAALHRLGFRPLELARSIWVPVVGAVGLVVAPLLAIRLLHPDLLVLAAGGIGGLALYLPVLALKRHELRTLRAS
ncbi:MAG TPA: lipopolysaccharide biosynthesis protein [Mycobacteriales bacterium]|nr:lipopolysaccharide biosynthesis protein [Mycobacteriales bacterium]